MLFVGCSSERVADPHLGTLDYPKNAPVPTYGIRAINHQGQTLYNVDMRVGYPDIKGKNPWPLFGILVPDTSKGYWPLSVPIPDRGRVSWDASDGTHFEKDVDILKVVGPNFTGYVIFNIRLDGSVDVGAKPSEK
jgi:hypothetical protein